MIITIAYVDDFDQFLRTFSNEGVAKRREHGCPCRSGHRRPQPRVGTIDSNR